MDSILPGWITDPIDQLLVVFLGEKNELLAEPEL